MSLRGALGAMLCAGSLLSGRGQAHAGRIRSDSTSYSLSPVAGRKFYHGPTDCSAMARVVIDSDAVRIDVSVTDDDLVFSDDPIHSDHVEVWIAIPEAEEQEAAYIQSSDSSLWLVNNSSNIEEFTSEVRDPTVSSIFQTDVPYHQLDSIENYGVKEDVDNELAELGSGTVRKTYVLFGQTHFGFLPRRSHAYLYDQEFLTPISKGLHCTPADVAGLCDYRSRIRNGGYSIAVSIPATALTFFSQRAVGGFKVLIDVVDVDHGSQETILSSSKSRRWGDARTYTPVAPTVPFGDRNLRLQLPPDSMEDIVKPVFFRSSTGWIATRRKVEEVNYPHRLRPHSLPNLLTVAFVREKFACRADTLDGKVLHVYTVPDRYSAVGQKDIVVFSDGQRLDVEQYVDAILLRSGKPALLIGEYAFTMGGCFASGMCGCNIEASLLLIPDPHPTMGELPGLDEDSTQGLPLAHWSGCNYNLELGDSIRFEDHAMEVPFERVIHGDGIVDFGNAFDWRTIISLDSDGQGLTMDLGKGIAVKVGWEESPGMVTHKRLTR